MASITLHGTPFHTVGELSKRGTKAPGFELVHSKNLEVVTLDSFTNKRKVLNIFPSLDTPTCAMSVRSFNEKAAGLDNTVVINISRDLPFAQQRFCGAEGIENAVTLSTFRSTFELDYSLLIADGPLMGLASRVVMVLDADNTVLYAQQVTEIADEPDYEAALAILK
ncbi:thiol peroxidase [Myxococcota bacterium]|nr:thiol peroxidase [Myxococcota bacterium]